MWNYEWYLIAEKLKNTEQIINTRPIANNSFIVRLRFQYTKIPSKMISVTKFSKSADKHLITIFCEFNFRSKNYVVEQSP